MDTIVLKFGGSSVSDNIKLNIVAEKIISFVNKGNKVVVVVSAQGKTTDKLLEEALELDKVPNDRELDVLLSSGEQMSISKLSILLNKLGFHSISLTGWQAGICTNNTNQNAIIEAIDTSRINEELDKGKIVIIAGFQGINENLDITTLGRGGSDTSAVAIAAALNAKHCYLFSDVDGVYTSDPNKTPESKKLKTLSYEEMMEISAEGAKVLHNRCVEIGEKFSIPIITKSTFNNKPGSVISHKIEESGVKSIVKNDNIVYIHAKAQTYSIELFNTIYEILINNGIFINNLANNSIYSLDIKFTIKTEFFNKFCDLLENELNMIDCTYFNVSKISIIGYGIMNNDKILKDTMKIIEENKEPILRVDLSDSKIAIMFKGKVSDSLVEQLHRKLI